MGRIPALEPQQRRPAGQGLLRQLPGLAARLHAPHQPAEHAIQQLGRALPPGVDPRLAVERDVPAKPAAQQERRPRREHLGHLLRRSLCPGRRPARRRPARDHAGPGHPGQPPAQHDRDLWRQHLGTGLAAGQPQALGQRAQRHTPTTGQLQRRRRQDLLHPGPAVLPAARRPGPGLHLPRLPLQPHAHQEPRHRRGGHL